MPPATTDLLSIVEAAYQIESPADAWLQGLSAAVRPHVDEGFGLAGFEYYRPGEAPPQIVQSIHMGIPPGLNEIYSSVFARMDPEIQQRPFRLGPCVTGSQMMGMRREFREHPHMKKYVQRFGMYDSLWITAAEPSGYGLGFHSGRAKISWASRELVQRWGRIAAHLSSAVRLRRRLEALAAERRASQPEAVLDPRGKVYDACGPAAEKHALECLRGAVLAVEKLRGPMRRRDPDRALRDWKGLVAGRWSLIDQIEHDGRRFIVARQNEPTAAGPRVLTARERQVIGYAKLGHTNKLIAYDLGIADSTVRVLLARAAAKLGVSTRRELLAAYRGDDAPPESRV
jgi:DNA-binding CsgD family transcriptional regulator